MNPYVEEGGKMCAKNLAMPREVYVTNGESYLLGAGVKDRGLQASARLQEGYMI